MIGGSECENGQLKERRGIVGVDGDEDGSGGTAELMKPTITFLNRVCLSSGSNFALTRLFLPASCDR